MSNILFCIKLLGPGSNSDLDSSSSSSSWRGNFFLNAFVSQAHACVSCIRYIGIMCGCICLVDERKCPHVLVSSSFSNLET